MGSAFFFSSLLTHACVHGGGEGDTVRTSFNEVVVVVCPRSFVLDSHG